MKTTTLLAVAATLAFAGNAYADEAAPAAAEKPAAVEEKVDDPLPIHVYVNTGIYSGYQLYGSLVNSEPTWQTYAEANYVLPTVGDVDLGYLGVGIWSNTDLTDKRRDGNMGRLFNEWDFNVHWGKTFWLDDDKKWGLDYRTSVVWYYYPPCNYRGGRGQCTNTTVDWDHSFALLNPYLIPFIDVVHEYKISDGNLLQFGVKKPFQVNDDFSLTPSLTFVWRNSNYGWCFPHFGLDENFEKINSCLATMKIQLDANYKINENFGIFAKIAYCSIIDDDLRDATDACSGCDYGAYKDFAWGGVGIEFMF